MFANFPKYIHSRSLGFFESENFAARAANFAEFLGIELIKIYLPDRHYTVVSIFKNRKKFFITPPYSTNLQYMLLTSNSPYCRTARNYIFSCTGPVLLFLFYVFLLLSYRTAILATCYQRQSAKSAISYLWASHKEDNGMRKDE